MPIKNIQIGQAGLVGVEPKFDYILTDDTVAEVLTAGYLNHSVDTCYSFSEGDIVCVITQASGAGLTAFPSTAISATSGMVITGTVITN